MIRIMASGSRLRSCTGLAILWLLAVSVTGQSPSDKSALTEEQAAAAFSQNRFEDAAKLYQQGVKARPQWAEGWGYLAASYFMLNRFAEAREAYRHTTLLTPKNGPSWAYMGLCEFQLKNYRRAFDHLIKGEQLGLGSDASLLSRAHYALALLWETAGQFDMATKEISFLAAAGDKSDPVIEATGLIVLRMPIFPYEIPPTKHDMIMKVGAAGWELNAKQLEDARKLYKDLIADYPREPNLHYAYGMALTVSDQEAAVAELEKELELNPKHVTALIEAAFLYLEMGQIEKSQVLAERAAAVDPKNYAPHNIIGRIMVQTGHADRGIQELETAVKLAPSIASSHFNLAQAYQKAGKSADAAREFAAFRALDHPQEGQSGSSEEHR